jgi:hypothetical protein
VRFRGSNHIDLVLEERALARVSKGDHSETEPAAILRDGDVSSSG